MIAATELPGELSIEKKWHAGGDGARSDRIARDQSLDRRLDEGHLRWCKIRVSRSGRAGRDICGSLRPRNRAAKGLRRSPERAIVQGRRGRTTHAGDGARE
jgi:hypothetical protein